MKLTKTISAIFLVTTTSFCQKQILYAQNQQKKVVKDRPLKEMGDTHSQNNLGKNQISDKNKKKNDEWNEEEIKTFFKKIQKSLDHLKWKETNILFLSNKKHLNKKTSDACIQMICKKMLPQLKSFGEKGDCSTLFLRELFKEIDSQQIMLDFSQEIIKIMLSLKQIKEIFSFAKTIKNKTIVDSIYTTIIEYFAYRNNTKNLLLLQKNKLFKPYQNKINGEIALVFAREEDFKTALSFIEAINSPEKRDAILINLADYLFMGKTHSLTEIIKLSKFFSKKKNLSLFFYKYLISIINKGNYDNCLKVLEHQKSGKFLKTILGKNLLKNLYDNLIENLLENQQDTLALKTLQIIKIDFAKDRLFFEETLGRFYVYYMKKNKPKLAKRFLEKISNPTILKKLKKQKS